MTDGLMLKNSSIQHMRVIILTLMMVLAPLTSSFSNSVSAWDSGEENNWSREVTLDLADNMTYVNTTTYDVFQVPSNHTITQANLGLSNYWNEVNYSNTSFGTGTQNEWNGTSHNTEPDENTGNLRLLKTNSLNQIIKHGLMRLKEVKQTYSPSMDIQISSNFERQIFESFGHDSEKVNQIMREYSIKGEYEFDKSIISNLQSIYESTAVSNTNTIETISYYKKKYDYLSDPHTATGLSILKNVDPDHPYISLACAHPAKFNDAVEKATGSKSLTPKELENIFDKKEKMTILNNETEAVKSLILKNL